jgi:hypothetical protein
MKIIRIIGTLCSVFSATVLFANDFSAMIGNGVQKITVDNLSIRQITCEGKNFTTSISGTNDKIIEIYFTNEPFSDEKIKAAGLKNEDISKIEAKLSIEKKELKIVPDKKSKDGKYLTIFTPKDISIIVTLESGDLKVKDIKGELLLDGKSMDTDISKVTGVINYRNKSGDLKVNDFEGVMDIKTYSGDISLSSITGSLTVENTSGDFTLKKFDGRIKAKFQVGDIDISSAKFTSSEIENQSGDINISDSKGGSISVRASLGGVSVKNSEIEMIKAELSAGEIELNGVKADLDIEISMGDLTFEDFSLAGKADSKIKMSFGEISLGFKDPFSYDFLRSKNDEKVDYRAGMELDNDVRICTKNKKCLKIEKSMGEITVK